MVTNAPAYHNGYRIREYCNRGIFVDNLSCSYAPQILVNTLLQWSGVGWGKLFRKGMEVLLY